MDSRLRGNEVRNCRVCYTAPQTFGLAHLDQDNAEQAMARAPKRSAERCPTHPGAFLREMVLPAISVSKVEIAAALGVSRQTL